MNYWWCNQSDQWELERDAGIVSSQDSTLAGGNVTNRRRVGEVRAGDLVVHYGKKRILALSMALEDGGYHDELPLVGGRDYERGWRFSTNYYVFKKPIPFDRLKEQLLSHMQSGRIKHYPVDSKGNVRFGYFFPFDEKGVEAVLQHLGEQPPAWMVRALDPGAILADEVDEAGREYIEGGLVRVCVNRYERDDAARQACIDRHGRRCKICGICLKEEYGDVADRLIHVHHLQPLGKKGGQGAVDPARDLIPVCPNCHAVIHLGRNEPYTPEEVCRFRERAAAARDSRKTDGGT